MDEYLRNLIKMSKRLDDVDDSELLEIPLEVQQEFISTEFKDEIYNIFKVFLNVNCLNPGMKLLSYHYINQTIDEITLKRINHMSHKISNDHLTSFVTAYCYICKDRFDTSGEDYERMKPEEGITVTLFNLMNVTYNVDGVYLNRDALKKHFYHTISTIEGFSEVVDPDNVLDGDEDKLSGLIDNNIESSLDIIFTYLNEKTTYMLEDHYYTREQ